MWIYKLHEEFSHFSRSRELFFVCFGGFAISFDDDGEDLLQSSEPFHTRELFAARCRRATSSNYLNYTIRSQLSSALFSFFFHFSWIFHQRKKSEGKFTQNRKKKLQTHSVCARMVKLKLFLLLFQFQLFASLLAQPHFTSFADTQCSQSCGRRESWALFEFEISLRFFFFATLLSLSFLGKGKGVSQVKNQVNFPRLNEISSQAGNDDDDRKLKLWDENFPIYYSNRPFHLEVGGVRWVWLWLFSWELEELEGCEVTVDILCLSFSTTLIWGQLQFPSTTLICFTFTLSPTRNFISYSKLSGYSIFDFLRIENQLTSQQQRSHHLKFIWLRQSQ